MFLARLVKSASIAACAGFLAVTASAQQTPQRDHLLSFSVGYFDILDNADDPAVDLRVEFRPDYPFLLDTDFAQLKPFVGVEATTDGAVYGLGGILFDFFVGDRFVVTPSLGVGGYSDGGGVDLGHGIEFRSQFEVGYRFRNRSRLTAAFSHISNAGLGDDNPGVEILGVYYHFPLRSLLGG